MASQFPQLVSIRTALLTLLQLRRFVPAAALSCAIAPAAAAKRTFVLWLRDSRGCANVGEQVVHVLAFRNWMYLH